MNFLFVRGTNDLKNATVSRGFLDLIETCFGPASRDQHPSTLFSAFDRALERSYIFILSAFRKLRRVSML